MILNAHSYYSLRYGVISLEDLIDTAIANNYEAVALTDINNSSASLDFVKICFEKGIKPIVGMEFKDGNKTLFIAVARNNEGFREINELMTEQNINNIKVPERPRFSNSYIIYTHDKYTDLRENEYIGIRPNQLNKLVLKKNLTRYVILQSFTYKDYQGYETHKRLRAIDNNALLSQLTAEDIAGVEEFLIPAKKLLKRFEDYPQVIVNTKRIVDDCSFCFDFAAIKNKKHFTGSAYGDKELLRKLAYEGLNYRYGNDAVAEGRIQKELEIIDRLGFSSYFLITEDMVRIGMQSGFYHVGRGSGANSVVAYCLRITDVCPIELDLYFERFLNPKRKSPPDFDIDYSWKERDRIFEYLFKKYGTRHTALLGAMSTFKGRSIIREMGKVHGLPKEDIDRMVKNPNSPLNNNSLCREILSYYNTIADFPNIRSIHAGGVLITEEPITCYTTLDLPPKGFPTSQFDMYTAEDSGFEKLDVLSQRGIGHLKDSVEIVKRNRGIETDMFDFETFKNDAKVREQLKSGDTIGCFYVESPAMRGLLKKLKCDNYPTLVAASSIIRPGVARSGMMGAYIHRHHNPDSFEYLHPVMKEQLQETYGVMVYQEDVLKVGIHFGGLDPADADVLRRMMSGKSRNKKHLLEIEAKYYDHCKKMGYSYELAKEVWRQIESFAGYSFSKAHSASYAVESYQSLYYKSHFPLEFMVSVIRNFGGFYATWVYVNEAKKAGGRIHLPCVNRGTYQTSITGIDIFLGFVHIKSLEGAIGETIEIEREQNGIYLSLDDFVSRMNIGLESLCCLIRANAFRFTGQNKHQLLWQAHMLLDKQAKKAKQPVGTSMFYEPPIEWEMPNLEISPITNLYDELELFGFIISESPFKMLKTGFRGDCKALNLIQFVGKTVRMVGNFVDFKPTSTVKGEAMAFGTFLDDEDGFFDTVHFPPCLRAYPFAGSGIYLIMGKVTSDFDFPSLEVEKMAKLPIKANPIE